jgi:hypothetical protein
MIDKSTWENEGLTRHGIAFNIKAFKHGVTQDTYSMAASPQIHIWLGGWGKMIQHGVRNPTIDTYRFRFAIQILFFLP